MIYPISPVAKPRMTRSDKWKKRPCVMKYRDFKDLCRFYEVKLPQCGSGVTFCVPMPMSWSKKKKEKMNLMPHQQTPDLDNLLKALCDAVYQDDSCIWNFSKIEKLWAYEGSITIIGT